MGLIGKFMLILQLDAYELIEPNISILTGFVKKEKQVNQAAEEEVIDETWRVLKQLYGQQLEIKKNKTHQIMDMFEQAFYKYTFKKSESQFENTNLFIQIYEARNPAIKREFIKMLVGLL